MASLPKEKCTLFQTARPKLSKHFFLISYLYLLRDNFFPPSSDGLSRLRASPNVDRRTEEWEGEPPVNGLVQREMDSGYRVRTQTFFFVLQLCDFRVTKNCSKN